MNSKAKAWIISWICSLFFAFLFLIVSHAAHAKTGCIGNCTEGRGTRHFHTGGRYVGEWVKNQRSGQGEFTSVLGRCDLYETIHQFGHNDRFRDFSEIPFDYCMFKGTWREGVPHGGGVLTLKFDIIHIYSERVFEIMQRMSFVNAIISLRDYGGLPAKIDISGIWKDGLPDDCKLSVWDGKGKIFYQEQIGIKYLKRP